MDAPGRRLLRVKAGAVAAAVVASVAGTTSPGSFAASGAAPGPAPSGPGGGGGPRSVVCSSVAHPALAGRVEEGLREVLRTRPGTVSFDVRAEGFGLRCGSRPAALHEAASVIKVLLMEATLRRAESLGRELTARERELLHEMIIFSDNVSTDVLWEELDRSLIRGVLEDAGARDTVLGSSWGLSRTSARDQTRLLGLLTEADSGFAGRDYALDLLRQVCAEQRWGVSAGAPEGVRVQLKNGWLPRDVHGWRVHSVGAFTGGPGGTYRMAVLSHDNRTMGTGVRTIERLASVVHRGLASEGDPGPAGGGAVVGEGHGPGFRVQGPCCVRIAPRPSLSVLRLS